MFPTARYILLSGLPPFYGTHYDASGHESPFQRRLNEEQMKAQITTGEVRFFSPHFDNVSEAAKDLIKACLTKEPAKRITVDGMLAHPWLASQQSAAELPGAAKALRRFNARQKFRTALMKLMVTTRFQLQRELEELCAHSKLAHSEVRAMRKAFLKVAPSGSVDEAQFVTIMGSLGLGYLPLKRLFQLFDRPPIGV